MPEQLGKIGEKPEDYKGWDLLTLPESGDVLKVRPLLVQDTRKAAELATEELTEAGISNAATIIEVNGGTPDNHRELFKYYLALPPRDVDVLRKHVRESSPALDPNVPHTCDNERCKKPFNYNLGLHYDFFL